MTGIILIQGPPEKRINRIKEKTHLIFSIATEKKMENFANVRIKIFRKSGISGKSPNLIKGIHEKPIPEAV
jgi:predicted ATP-grasp superfamily ATP-dependent carboligase